MHPGTSNESSRQVIQASLAALRAHLGAEVAFVGRFEAGRRFFEYVDAGDSFCPVAPGDSDPLEETYCARVADGRLPQLILDTSALPEAANLPITQVLNIGSYVSVPLLGPDGVSFGSLCCFSRDADPRLRERDLVVMRVLGDVVGAHLHALQGDRYASEVVIERVSDVISDGGPAIALQPIFDIRRDVVSGYEALARFPSEPGWAPDRWFAEATAVGLGPELEEAAIQAALRLLPDIPEPLSLSVNLSPEALAASDTILKLLTGEAPGRMVVELTEHQPVLMSQFLVDRLDQLRSAGVRIAVDDAGSGYAGLEHILDLRPDVLKLDRALVRGIASHAGRQAMCDAMVRFAGRTGALLVAEGVETDDDLQVLRYLGVRHAQGFLLGMPEIRS